MLPLGCWTPHIPGVRVSNSDGNQQSRADRLKKKVNREVGSSSRRLCLLQDTSGRTEGKLKKRETIRRAAKSGTRELLRKEECSTDQGTSAPYCYMSAQLSICTTSTYVTTSDISLPVITSKYTQLCNKLLWQWQCKSRWPGLGAHLPGEDAAYGTWLWCCSGSSWVVCLSLSPNDTILFPNS